MKRQVPWQSLNTHSWILLGWFRRPQLWATGDWPFCHDNTPTHASHVMQSVLVKRQITQVTQPLYRPYLAPGDFQLFPKLKSLLKGKRFQTIREIQENTTRQPMATGRTVQGPRCLLWRGLRRHCPIYNVSVSFIVFNKCLCFSYCMAGYLLDRPRIHQQKKMDKEYSENVGGTLNWSNLAAEQCGNTYQILK